LSTLRDAEYPALYVATNEASLAGQRMTLRALRFRLGALALAALGGAFVIRKGDVDIAGLVALIAFAGALGAGIFVLSTRPERRWYEGRAAAESVKTLTWRYMSGGEPFSSDLGDTQADELLLAEMRGLLEGLHDLGPISDESAATQITGRMRTQRKLGFEARRSFYESGRIEDQRLWYSRKDRWNAKRATLWLLASVSIEVVGVVAAALKAFRVIEIDVLGLLGAAGSGAAAWIQAKQYQNLATAYSIAAQELATVRSELGLQTAATWARFVDEAEEAISREHTMWRASRGVHSSRRA
jgi:hypothetical protein